MAVITASPSNFIKLLELQKLSIDHLEAINNNIAESLVYERLQALEQLAMANELDKQEDETRRVEGLLSDILDAIKSNIASISNTNVTTNQQQTSTFVSKNTSSSAVITQSEEDRKEADAQQTQIISVLKQIAKNTTPVEAISKAKEDSGGGLGAIAAALAIALGAVVAAVKSQVKAIMYFLDLLVPDKLTAAIAKSVASFVAGLSMELDLLKALVSEKLSGVVKVIDSIGDWIKGIFAATGESKIGSIISSFLGYVGKVLDPFVDAVKAIMGFLEGPTSKVWEFIKGTFSTIGSYLDDFGKMIGKVAGILEKFFLPLTIIMTVWDTVKGAIEGYEKEGIIGGIKGAITGFFNSLIFGPIDMLKSAIAWLAGVFGFDEAKKVLESFSVEKIFKDFIDMVFSPVNVLKGIIKKMGDFFESIKGLEIPGFSFKVPNWVPLVGGKETTFGPWKPFGGASQANSTTGGSDAAAASAPAQSAPIVTPTAASGSAGSAQVVSNNSTQVSNMKEDAASGRNVNSVVAPSVNNNVSNTQVATMKPPIRSNDSSLDRYTSSRLVY